MIQAKTSTTLGLTSQFDLLVKATPILHLFLTGAVFSEPMRKTVKIKSKVVA